MFTSTFALANDTEDTEFDFSDITVKVVDVKINTTSNLLLEEQQDFKSNEIGIRSLPEKFTTASYTHNVYDRNNKLIATFVTSLEGWYDRYTSWSEISYIGAYFTYSATSSLSLSNSRSGSNASTSLYLAGMLADTQYYSLSTTGNWSN